MIAKKYLYGASVQGIQQFIFKTNKLVEIAGASELVENICTGLFRNFLGEKNFNKGELIIGAAGSIKYLFSDEDICRKTFLEFPKVAREAAPGITVSQAVVEVDGDDLSKALSELESKLRAQRNYQPRSITLGLMGLKRSRQSGLPAVKVMGEDYADAATIAKKGAAELLALSRQALRSDITYDDITHDISSWEGKNNWIAVCHADGNGLGSVVKVLSADKDKYAEFSKKLDQSTKAAAKSAFAYISEKHDGFKNQMIPIRPVVLGGDDFTVICRGDIALEYIKVFIERFEAETEANLGHLLKLCGKTKLSASAGIAFIKSSYPFSFAYELAENLCSVAKEDSRELSSIMFHKVQDSFIEDYKDIVARELQIRKADISFQFGPYYVTSPKDSTKWTVDKLLEICGSLQGETGNTVKSGIRNWLSLLSKDKNMAEQKLDRMKAIVRDKSGDYEKIILEATTKVGNSVPAYDILAINTILSQETKDKDTKE